MAFHTYQELKTLGEQIRDKSIQVTTDVLSTDAVKRIHAAHANDALKAANPPVDQKMIHDWAQGEYAHIPDLYTTFGTPDPVQCQPIIDAFWAASYALRPTLWVDVSEDGKKLTSPIPDDAWTPKLPIATRLSIVQDARMRYWAGQAGDTFESYFLLPLQGQVHLQSELAAGLALATTAHRRIRDETHTSIWDIGTKTLTVLDQVGASDPRSAATVITVIGAVVAVMLSVPTGGLDVAGAAGLALAVKNFVQTTAPIARQKPVGGGTVSAVIASMQQRITDLTRAVDDEEQSLASFLDKTDQEVGQTLQSPSSSDIVDLSHKSMKVIDSPDGLYPL